MIKSIRHKGLKRLFEDEDPRGVNSEHVEKLRDILATFMPHPVSRMWTCRGFGCMRSRAS
jgi:hypothetical protein